MEHIEALCKRTATEVVAVPRSRRLRSPATHLLVGKRLACHCAAQSLPCHAEVLAVVANECVPSSMLCGLCD